MPLNLIPEVFLEIVSTFFVLTIWHARRILGVSFCNLIEDIYEFLVIRA